MGLRNDLQGVTRLAAAGSIVCGLVAVASLTWTVVAFIHEDMSPGVSAGFALAEIGSALVFALIWLMLRHVSATYGTAEPYE
jgi:hypothetical protein